MAKVLITGATGNVGKEVIHALSRFTHQVDLYAGVRDIITDPLISSEHKLHQVKFDFTDASTYKSALAGCEILYLLRPPQISEVEKYFKPIISLCVEMNVKHIVFLSVQGVENSKIIPHHKIEQLIKDSNISYTFLRPAYFMQNFTTTLNNDLVSNERIFLPAGNAKFTMIDVRDIGSVSAKILANVSQHTNVSYELTCSEKLTFSEMAAILSNQLGKTITFESPNLIRFFIEKRKQKIPTMLILVMIMLHYLPRFQKEPNITDWVEKLTGRAPITFRQFVNDNKTFLIKGKSKQESGNKNGKI